MEYLTIDKKTLHKLQTFSSVEAMNEAVQIHKHEHKLNKTDRAILDAISRYACKYAGVCFLRKQRIAENAGFKSRRTAIRACNRLETLGVIKQYETRRISGDRRQAANLIVIQPVEIVERQVDEESPLAKDNRQTDTSLQKRTVATNCTKTSPTHKETHRNVTADCHSNKTSTKTFTDINIQLETFEETDEFIKRGLRTRIPENIYMAFEPFFDGQTLYEIYGILLRAKAKIDRHILLEDYGDRYVDAFYNVVRLYKRGKISRFKGYLYVTWERLSAEISRQIYAGLA